MFQDTIVAPASGGGVAAISLIRVSGKDAISIVSKAFKGKNLAEQPSHTLHFGTIRDSENTTIDEVLVSLFKEPTSYTKENLVEISCHGSPFIVQKIIQMLLENGARMAQAGEFTKRAFLNGQFDLAQAEAVADLIASDSESSHKIAMQQMRGGFSKKIKELREQLLHFAAMIELELDFGEEDVEFANRNDLKTLVFKILNTIQTLISSFEYGNAIKNGIPVAIVGKPNAGKSTLLNVLLQEEKAIVSEIAGTTRDTIEDEAVIEGIRFRFVDTAGLRETTDTIEAIGVERAKQKMKDASLILYLFDSQNFTTQELHDINTELDATKTPYFLIGNKVDAITEIQKQAFEGFEKVLFISAKKEKHLDELKNALLSVVKNKQVVSADAVVSNLRHLEGLQKAEKALEKVVFSIEKQIFTDLLALEIRASITALGDIIGDQITTDDILGHIFSKFCIGK